MTKVMLPMSQHVGSRDTDAVCACVFTSMARVATRCTHALDTAVLTFSVEYYFLP